MRNISIAFKVQQWETLAELTVGNPLNVESIQRERREKKIRSNDVIQAEKN